MKRNLEQLLLSTSRAHHSPAQCVCLVCIWTDSVFHRSTHKGKFPNVVLDETLNYFCTRIWHCKHCINILLVRRQCVGLKGPWVDDLDRWLQSALENCLGSLHLLQPRSAHWLDSLDSLRRRWLVQSVDWWVFYSFFRLLSFNLALIWFLRISGRSWGESSLNGSSDSSGSDCAGVGCGKSRLTRTKDPFGCISKWSRKSSAATKSILQKIQKYLKHLRGLKTLKT